MSNLGLVRLTTAIYGIVHFEQCILVLGVSHFTYTRAGPESYATCFLSRSQRSLCAQLRCGILPLAIEVGRFTAVLEEKRLCSLCDLQDIENEYHFMFYCPLYDDLRVPLFEAMQRQPDLFWLDDGEKLEWLFRLEVFKTATFISNAWKRRQSVLFN